MTELLDPFSTTFSRDQDEFGHGAKLCFVSCNDCHGHFSCLFVVLHFEPFFFVLFCFCIEKLYCINTHACARTSVHTHTHTHTHTLTLTLCLSFLFLCSVTQYIVLPKKVLMRKKKCVQVKIFICGGHEKQIDYILFA